MQSVWLFDFPSLLARYRASYPGIVLKLVHTSSTELARLLRERVIDMTFATALDESSSDFVSVPILTLPSRGRLHDRGHLRRSDDRGAWRRGANESKLDSRSDGG